MYGIATQFPGEVAKVQKAVDVRQEPQARQDGTALPRGRARPLVRERLDVGLLGVAALMAFIWLVPMNGPAEMNNGEWQGACSPDLIWLFVGWIPIAVGVTGGLQKAGYRRLAAAYAIALSALITWFFHSQLKDSRTTDERQHDCL